MFLSDDTFYNLTVNFVSNLKTFWVEIQTFDPEVLDSYVFITAIIFGDFFFFL